jgi:cobalt-zinc-cadmium efflux system protein
VPILDRTLSLLIALYILFNVFKNGKESIRIILQRRAMVFSVDESKAKILENKEIKNSHDCHLWTMVGEYNIITVHLLMVNKSISWQKANQVKKEI